MQRLEQAGLEPGDPIVRAVPIATPAKTVWAAISKAGNLTNFHPFCAANPVESWPGTGVRDKVEYYNGVVFQRDFIDWIEGVGYDLEIGPNPPSKSAKVSWRIEPNTADGVSFSIAVTPYLKVGMPKEARQAYLDKVFGDVIASYLESVLKGLQAFVTTGVPVREDQFGSHPLYSRGW